jgi:hypothetical protein
MISIFNLAKLSFYTPKRFHKIDPRHQRRRKGSGQVLRVERQASLLRGHLHQVPHGPGANLMNLRCGRKVWDKFSPFFVANRYVPGTDVMIFKIFSPKIFAKKWRFWLKTKLNFEKKLIITLVFKKNAIFLAKIGKNRQKLCSYHRAQIQPLYI